MNMATSKIHNMPTVEALSSTATIYRLGAMRILVLNEYSLNENVVLAESDRPPAGKTASSVMWAHTSSGKYFKGGNTHLNDAGIISAYATTSYNSQTAQTALDSTEKIRSTLIWSVV